MKTTIKLLTATLSIAILASCQTEEDPVVNQPEPSVVFDIANPGEGTMYGLGDTIKLDGSVSYEPGLHGYSLEIINTTADSTVFYMDVHAHGGEIDFMESWVNNVSSHSDMMFIVSAAITHEGDIESDTIHFHCHPM